MDYFFQDRIHDEGEKHTVRMVGEYAFAHWFSVEVGVPYTFVNEEGHDSVNNLDTVDVGVKFASFAFEDQGSSWAAASILDFPLGTTRDRF